MRRVIPEKLFHQHGKGSQVVSVAAISPIAQRAHLPEDELARGIDDARVHQEVGGFIRLAAIDRRIDVQVREQAILRRYAGQHARRVAFGMPPAYRLVGWVREDARMPVKSAHHGRSGSYSRQDELDHLLVALEALLSLAVEA